jgi:two-component system, OmpR family, response regulator QseB
MRILLVEDDAMVGESLSAHLRAQDDAVDWVRDGAAATAALAAADFDLVLLDLGLPRKDGLKVLRDLRAGGNRVPVLILTARDATGDKVRGLDAGADDYLVKPFDPQELSARMRALVRRRGGRAGPLIEHRDLTLDPATRRVTRAGAEVALSPREFALLHALLEHPGRVLSRAQLEERLYGFQGEVESNAVEVHLHGLRRKLGPGVIANVRGVGWRVAP